MISLVFATVCVLCFRFIAIFLCPLLSTTRFPEHTPPPRLVIWLFRWSAFRLLLGAGMSKIGQNSSACWKDLTCTSTHYFTQPIPNPLSWRFHHFPDWDHHVEVGMTSKKRTFVTFFQISSFLLIFRYFSRFLSSKSLSSTKILILCFRYMSGGMHLAT